MAAKHITIARESGIEAGFEALVEYLTTPLGSSNPRMESVIDALDGLPFDEALQVYAETFADALTGTESTPRETGVVSIRKVTKTAKKSGGSTTRRSTRKTASSVITSGEAWEALGAGEEFEPNDHSRPANNGQLYRLNVGGLLRLA